LQEKLESLAHQKMNNEPSIAVIVAARHEPKEVLEETFISLRNLAYENKEIYFLDDSSDERYKNDAEDLTERFKVTLFRRGVRHGAKAGIVNDFLKTLKNKKYVAIFDADQCPLPEFLHRIVPILESDENLAFVQTPQFYTNISVSRVAKASALQQCVFYEYICEGKSVQNAMFCCGTNVIFRKQALDDVGGLDETTVTEDFATSLKMHLRGWKSLYYNHACVFGKAPEDLSNYFKQQFRWANGTISVLKMIVRAAFSEPSSLSLQQWWEYFLSGSYYFVGLAFFAVVCFPILYIFFNVCAFFATPEMYLLIFVPYILLSLTIFYSLLRMRNYEFKDLFTGQLLIQISFPVHIKAALAAFFGTKVHFGITEKTGGSAMPYRRLWPQLSLMTLNYIACIWGLNRFVYERDVALLINCFWAIYHCGIFSSIFYFNQEREESSPT
jgi:cellulose synthase (UDP-forming)